MRIGCAMSTPWVNCETLSGEIAAMSTSYSVLRTLSSAAPVVLRSASSAPSGGSRDALSVAANLGTDSKHLCLG